MSYTCNINPCNAVDFLQHKLRCGVEDVAFANLFGMSIIKKYEKNLTDCEETIMHFHENMFECVTNGN